MQFSCEFFESLNEDVYISDMKTYDLLYVNAHLRKMLGLGSHEAYRGQKCYALLQGLEEPCAFCTNSKLRAGAFYEWTYHNPLLKQDYNIKDTILDWEGRPCRMELAVETGRGASAPDPHHTPYLAKRDTVIDECLQQVYNSANVDDALMQLLAYIGREFHCGRAYIFEDNGDAAFNNTYEWCAPGVTPQKEHLQNVPVEAIDWWIGLFQSHQIVVLNNLDHIREYSPMVYDALKPQEVTTLVTGPIYLDQRLIGFFGVDNPLPESLPVLKPLLYAIGYFFASVLKRRNLIQRLEDLSFRDSLTGALNRNALAELDAIFPSMDTLGVLYCDISGLKQINDTLGHDAGDELIIQCYRTIQKAVGNHNIYRAGGDEFVVVLPNVTEIEFNQYVETLKQTITDSDQHIAVGHSWTDRKPFHLQMLVAHADKVMYEDKRKYYENSVFLINKTRPQRHDMPELVRNTAFHQFIQANFFDAETLFHSITSINRSQFLYFGDLQTNLFYISDNMRDAFGFPSNVVPDLLNTWIKRICSPEDQQLYCRDIADMMAHKRTVHDLRYQVRDCFGNHMWVHCCGLLQWNDTYTVPLFFSGCLSTQDAEFMVDPVTRLLQEAAATQKLLELHAGNQTVPVIVFSLNGFTEINRIKGRQMANQMLRSIVALLTNRFNNTLSFFRLDGMRFMALVSPHCTVSTETLIDAIRSAVAESYRSSGVLLRCPCSVGLLQYPADGVTPQVLVENAIDLIATAKSMPDRPYVVHSQQDRLIQKELATMAIQLNRDIYNNMANFRVVVQPIVSAQTGQICGGETLLRWSYGGKDISPTVFVPILERSGQIIGVGRWVFEQVVRCCKRLLTSDSRIRLSFNVSYLQIMDDDFVPFLRKTLRQHHMDGSHLTVELTETHFVESSERLQQFIKGCHELGLQMALDDFGAGYSSLALLLQFPTGIVKLDRSLLTQITTSPEILHFIQSIVYACHSFGQRICAEGVETEEQAAILRDMGCDLIQGFHYYEPMELRDLYELTARNVHAQ